MPVVFKGVRRKPGTQHGLLYCPTFVARALGGPLPITNGRPGSGFRLASLAVGSGSTKTLSNLPNLILAFLEFPPDDFEGLILAEQILFEEGDPIAVQFLKQLL